MLELADIFDRYGASYREAYGDAMLPSHRRAMDDVMGCRTGMFGGHVYRCDHCARVEFAYHSCANRACPKCRQEQTDQWLENRRAELLPVNYFHAIFTIPHVLNDLVRSNQLVFYDILIKAAAQTLLQLGEDPKFVGGKIGLLAVLHTWGQTLWYHPHVHFLVTGGGVSDDGYWIDARQGFLFPENVLSRIFRAKFMDMAKAAFPQIVWPRQLWKHDWVVRCKPAAQGPQKTLDYLGRYIHRVALSNSRLVSMDNDQVTFRYKDYDDAGRWKTMRLPAHEFIRRFLQHVLPEGFHKVRYFGLWSPANRSLLHRVQLGLGLDLADEPLETNQPLSLEKPAKAQRICPHCEQGKMILIDVFTRRSFGRGPPR
jgi:hypothetical protein